MVVAGTAAILVQAGFCLLAILLLLLVASGQKKRQPSNKDAQAAMKSFVLWWVLLAAAYSEQMLVHLTRLFYDWTTEPLLARSIIAVAIMLAAFAFLLDYLIYIVTGTLRWRRIAVAYYVGLFVVLGAISPLLGPFEVIETSSGPSIEGTIPIAAMLVVLLIIAPILLALALQVRLFMVANDKTARYRIGMVWFSVVLFLLAFSVGDEIPVDFDASGNNWELNLVGGGIMVAGLLPLIGAWTAHRAYKPAAWVEKRFGIVAIGDEAAPSSEAAKSSAAHPASREVTQDEAYNPFQRKE